MYRIPQPTVFRENIREKIAKQIQPVKLAPNLDRAIYNYAIKEATTRKIIKKWENPYFTQLYVDRLRTIIRNLSEEAIANINSGETSVQTFAFMTHQEMNPERWASLIQQKAKRDASKFNNNIEASTDMYKCKKCRSKRCTYYEMQTRSADEPATIFVTCLDCGKHWRG
jgi:DNA-directed RNA polymerase subunit M/transcription elongation factor TFIIS